MSKKNIKEMRELIKTIEYHRRLYYLEQSPEISDSEYDLLERRLKELEQESPELIQPDSPSFKVGGYVADQHPSHDHVFPMMSLGNAYNEIDLADFVQKTREAVQEYIDNDHPGISFTTELKIDGLSLSLIYKYGSLTEAITRGDGTTGELVTANAKTLGGLPLFVPEWRKIERAEVRGEVYFSKTRFEQLNVQRLENQLDAFANPRNAASGSLRLLDSSETARRKLKIFIYQGLGDWTVDFPSHFTILNHLGTLGFPTNPHTRTWTKDEDIIGEVKSWADRRKELDYETDGMVIKLDQRDLYDLIGTTKKFPKWATAFKFQADQASTQIEAITIQVGRTGVLTPVAELNPVSLAGTTVSRATLHNFEEIARKDIRINDWVFIEKGGDIIPKVVIVITAKRGTGSIAFSPPGTCPSCSEPVEKEEGTVALKCVNLSCPAQLERRIQHFAQRKAMDIRGLGKEWIQELVKQKLLIDLPSIYHLQSKDLMELDRSGEKWIENLLREIELSKARPFVKFLFGLGIPMVGEKAAELLVDEFSSLDALHIATEEQIAAIHGIGEHIAWSVVHYLNQETNRQTLSEFVDLGLVLEDKKKDTSSILPLAGKTIVLTGTLVNRSRSQAGDILKELGAKITSSISSKTDFLLAGDKAGSKLAKAKKLNVEIVDEEWLETWQKE